MIKSATVPFSQLRGERQFDLLLEILREANEKANQAKFHNIGHEPLKKFEYDDQFGDIMDDIILGGN